MEKQTGTFGVYFMKGAFFFELEWLGNDLIARPIHSKDCNKVKVIGGTYKNLKALLKSEKGKEVQEVIDTLDFDFIVMGHGESVSYYINTKDGVSYCDLTVYGKG